MKRMVRLWGVLCLFFSLPAAEKISNLGRHPFYESENLTPGDLKEIVLTRAEDVKSGFVQAGYGELVSAFLEQIQQADMQSVEVHTGDTLMWMLSKQGREIKVLKELVWAGKKSISAYQFKIFWEGKLFEFIVPKVCGNISLKSVQEIPAPVSALKVIPNEVEKGKPVRIDVCESQNALKNAVTVKDQAGAIIKTLELEPGHCWFDITLAEAGSYTVTNEAEGQYGMKGKPVALTLKVNEPPSLPSPPPPPLPPPAKPKKWYVLADLGFARKAEPENFIFARPLGVQYRVSERFRLNFLVGSFINLNGSGYGTPIAFDVTFSYYLSKLFIAAGAGLWLMTRSSGTDASKLDLITNIGYELLATKKVTGALFLEGRIGTRSADFDNFSDFGRYGIGFRLTF